MARWAGASWLGAAFTPLLAGAAFGWPAAVEPSPAASVAGTEAAPDSPRVSLARFLDLAREGRYAEAARFLDVPHSEAPRAAELAQRLKAVLDRHLWIDLDLVSPRPEGDATDGFAMGTDQIGVVSAPGRPEPVRLVQRSAGESTRWVFSRGTVDSIDRWYADLPDRWVRDRLPGALLRPGPWEVLRWQWIALLGLVSVAAAGGALLAWVTRRVLGAAAARTRTPWDEALLRRTRGPLVLGFTIVLVYAFVPWLGLYAPARAFIGRCLAAGGALAVFWATWRGVDVAATAVRSSSWGRGSASASSVVSIGARLAKVVVLALGAVSALSALGYPVAGLLAGLGIGGVAVALAAQKTLENLFGSLALAVDQPIRVGDFVKVEDFVATVEVVGLRSTRFRTLDRTLITIPNGRVADMRLESLSARDRMRLSCTIGLVYGTTAAQMREVLAGIEAVLREHPKLWPDAVVVRLKELAAWSLDVEVMAWFQTPDWSEFQRIRQEVLLRFMEVVEGAGTSFAFPTRTVHLASEDRGVARVREPASTGQSTSRVT